MGQVIARSVNEKGERPGRGREKTLIYSETSRDPPMKYRVGVVLKGLICPHPLGILCAVFVIVTQRCGSEGVT